MIKECYLYEQLENNIARCKTCEHRCTISNTKFGFCGVRKNINGKLHFLFYNQSIAENIDPVEKKPLFDYLPGTKTLTIATVGCNFCCKWCQNCDISQITKTSECENAFKIGFELSPERIIKDAILAKCPSISYSYTEPTIFLEYALDTMKLAHEKGLKNIWVTNGFMTHEALDLVLPYLDAVNIDLKTFDDKKYQKYTCGQLAPILRNITKIHEKKVHLEITTLIVPGLNDKKSDLISIVKFIHKLDQNIPWHITQYHPAHKMIASPSPIALLKDIQAMAYNIGLKKVYLGNL